MDRAVPSPDPIGEPEAYQQHLLDLLGEDDPAQVQSETVASWERLLEEAGEDRSTRPTPTEWSVLECRAHEVDAEIVMRLAIGGSSPMTSRP